MLKVTKSPSPAAKSLKQLAKLHAAAAELPAVKHKVPPTPTKLVAPTPVRLRAGEEVYVNLGSAESAKGCALFYARPTDRGFIPTRASDGTLVQALEVVPDKDHVARFVFAKGNPTPDACKSWVATRRENGCLVMPLRMALKRKLVRELKATVNGVPDTTVYLPATWQPGHKLPLYVGLNTVGGRGETFTHKVKDATGAARNAAYIVRVSDVR